MPFRMRGVVTIQKLRGMIVSNWDKERLLRSTIIAGFAAALGLGGAPAFAQETDDVVETEEEEEEEAGSDDRIVVTGSRIQRIDINSVFPTISVGAEDIEKNAFTNIADALSEIPAFGNGVTTDGDGGQIGANFADFLDLGTVRTLTLVNGRRFVSQNVGAGGQQVDFGIIPIALVERIDTIGVGGAPVYGSDAIAGTINVILKDDFEGFDVTAQYGNDSESTGENYQVTMVAGANIDNGRGNVTMSAEYFHQEGMLQTDRPEYFFNDIFLSEVPPGNGPRFPDIDVDGDGSPDSVFRAFNLDGSSFTDVQLFTPGGVASPGSTFIPSIGLGAFPDGTIYQFDQTSSLVPFNPGQSIPGTSLFFAEGGEQINFFENRTQLRSPLDRVVFTSSFNYDILPSVTAFGEVLAANLESEDLADQSGFQTFAFGGFSSPLVFDVSNPFLSPSARATFDANGITTFRLQRTLDDILPQSGGSTETNVWRFVTGLRGDFSLADRNFFWEVSANAGQTTNKTSSTSLVQGRFLEALDAVVFSQADADRVALAGGNPAAVGNVGDIVCRASIELQEGTYDGFDTGFGTTSQQAPFAEGCAPLNLFGENMASPEAIDFVTAQTVSNNNIDQAVFNANIGGDLFDLPAGTVQFAAGYEARKESASLQPGGFQELGLGRGAAVPPTGGSYTTSELYAEALVPLVSEEMDIPLVYGLEIEGAIREIDNSQAGEFTAWTVAGRYSPIRQLTFRGNMTESLRAPSLSELFTPVVTAFEFADDPCDSRFIGDDPNYSANCAAEGLPTNFTSNVVNATARGRTGGNPNLRNETAEAYSIGAIFQPDYHPLMEGMTLQVDYINIEIADAIGALTLEAIMEACYGAEPGAFPNASCDAFSRDAGGQVVDFQSGQINSDSFSTEFLNARFDWNFDITDTLGLLGAEVQRDLGSLNFDAQVFHAIARERVVAGVAQNNTIGGFADPEWSGTLDFTWDYDALRVFWRAQWQDQSLFSPSGNNFYATPDDVVKTETDDWWWMHSMSVAYDVNEVIPQIDFPLTAQLNIDNVFDRDGLGLEEQVFDQFGFNEIFGRRYSVRLRAQF